jgi:hypothetical protein
MLLTILTTDRMRCLRESESPAGFDAFDSEYRKNKKDTGMID